MIISWAAHVPIPLLFKVVVEEGGERVLPHKISSFHPDGPDGDINRTNDTVS